MRLVVLFTRNLAWDQALQWGEKAKNGIKQQKKKSVDRVGEEGSDYRSAPVIIFRRR